MISKMDVMLTDTVTKTAKMSMPERGVDAHNERQNLRMIHRWIEK